MASGATLHARYTGEGVDPQTSVEDALQRLAALRDTIAGEKIPLSKRMHTLEAAVEELRRQVERQERYKDGSGMDLNTLEADIRTRRDELDYMSNLVTEFLSDLETRANASELAHMREGLDRSLSAIDNPALEIEEQFTSQLAGIELGMNRLQSLMGGLMLEGRAVSWSGEVVSGTFALYGPVAFFSDGERTSGIAIDGETEFPVIVDVGSSSSVIAATLSSGVGTLPLDPTLGKALAIAATDENLIEHILKGGIWIYPILLAAALSLLVALQKFAEIYSIKEVPAEKVLELVRLVRLGHRKEAHQLAAALPSPNAELLSAGVAYAEEPKELLEEIMLEQMVRVQPRLERLLPVIAVTAATAPLLGLLGTVTGMINTFKLITIFGTGDAKALSSGISEALITTEFGLIVAIPSLVLHAFLNRKAKAIMASLETNAIRFINGISARSTPEEAA